MRLTAKDFTPFYQQVHERQPFHWQQDLVARVLTEGRWPDLVDVPTGLGKTSMLDVAVFVAAATATEPGPHRLGRRRCFLVVDRRIVVDEATEHARKISDRLERAVRDNEDAVLGAVAAGLRSLAPQARGGQLLPVTRMRGGTTWASAWLDRPDRPGLVIGTVDQVGSRLLFRGYGVSDRRRPIDAALVGADALLLIDEAHLATALITTVKALRERDHCGLPLPGLDVVRLTATADRPPPPVVEPPESRPTRHRGPTDPRDSTSWLYSIDVAAHHDDDEAMRRLTAAKDLFLVETTAKTCPGVLADTAMHLAGVDSPQGTRAPAVLVVCNTVDRARAVHTLIDKQSRGPDGAARADVDLLIGRSRPLDRKDLVDRITPRFGTGRKTASRPVVLVATQTVEVGVNLDVDALVTESASWDALVQRLGRLNRLGLHQDRFPGQGPATAVVVHDGQVDGPIYGAARDRTWQHLASVAPSLPTGAAIRAPGVPGLGVSPLECRDISAAIPDGALAARPGVPLLQVPTLDAWANTAPVPLADPPVDVFLHGFDTGRAGVQLAWRDGLIIDDPFGDPFEDSDAEVSASSAHLLLTAMPIRTSEQVEVPFVAVQQWMSGQAAPLVSDLESAHEAETKPRQERDPFGILVWRSDRTGASGSGSAGAWVWIRSAQLRPGDQAVVPTERGGLDKYGWNPGSTLRVRDVAEAAALESRRPLLRLDSALGDRLGLTGPARQRVDTAVLALREAEQDAAAPTGRSQGIVSALVEALQSIPDESGTPEGEESSPLEAARSSAEPSPALMLAWLGSGPKVVEVFDPDDAVVVGGRGAPRVLQYLLTGGRVPPTPDASHDPGPVATMEGDDEDPAGSSVSGHLVPLGEHLARVRARARDIATALQLPPELVTVLEDAAGWHDVGKVEERFQSMLFGGDPFEAALAAEPVAKSGMAPADRSARQQARKRSGLPPGARHEAWSAALVEAHLAQRPAPYPGDADLLVHLVASHHGHARPWLPLVVDGQPHPICAVIDGIKVEVSSRDTVSLHHPARFTRLNDRYGRWGLALMEAIVRCADMTVSSEES